jgi:hypothetical protein
MTDARPPRPAVTRRTCCASAAPPSPRRPCWPGHDPCRGRPGGTALRGAHYVVQPRARVHACGPFGQMILILALLIGVRAAKAMASGGTLPRGGVATGKLGG